MGSHSNHTDLTSVLEALKSQQHATKVQVYVGYSVNLDTEQLKGFLQQLLPLTALSPEIELLPFTNTVHTDAGDTESKPYSFTDEESIASAIKKLTTRTQPGSLNVIQSLEPYLAKHIDKEKAAGLALFVNFNADGYVTSETKPHLQTYFTQPTHVELLNLHEMQPERLRRVLEEYACFLLESRLEGYLQAQPVFNPYQVITDILPKYPAKLKSKYLGNEDFLRYKPYIRRNAVETALCLLEDYSRSDSGFRLFFSLHLGRHFTSHVNIALQEFNRKRESLTVDTIFTKLKEVLGTEALNPQGSLYRRMSFLANLEGQPERMEKFVKAATLVEDDQELDGVCGNVCKF